MSNFLTRRSRAFAALVTASVALGAASSAQAAKVSGYSVTGGLTIWVEPASAPGEPRLACLATKPSVRLTGAGFDATPGGAKLYIQGLWQSKYGFGVPFPAGLLRSSDDSVTPLRDGENTVDPATALQLVGYRGSLIVADRSGLPSRGRVTLIAWYAIRSQVGGFGFIAPTFLPTKSTSFAFVDKPAGSCSSITGEQLLLKA